jgi:hypothetical protein
VQWQIGYRRSDVSGRDLEFLAEKMNDHERSDSRLVHFPAQLPADDVFSCNAVALWDFLPVRTV